jgi:hypothetical protein
MYMVSHEFEKQKLESGNRLKRDFLLKECDWTQMPDYNGANKASWATYRQALRDVPTQSGFPWAIQWPTKPE